jgi:hypothetical protein
MAPDDRTLLFESCRPPRQQHLLSLLTDEERSGP